jgi:hypothetical protein
MRAPLECPMVLEIMPSADAAQGKIDEQRREDFAHYIDNPVRNAVGFRRFIDVLVASKKPIVVHHGMLHISKLLSNFIVLLPDTLSGF